MQAAIGEAQRYQSELPAPPNEANTCDWVIRPLLVAAGYPNHEILAQTSDLAKKIPDYTLLHGTEHTWYLEAKAWSVALESDHVDQGMNYAHSNGKRWVVLTNGKEWRLYDDHIQGVSADRLVVTATLGDTGNMLKFLRAVSRDSIIAQKVVLFAGERRVREYVTKAIADPSSALVQAVVAVVRKQLPNVTVEAHVVSEVLSRVQSQPVSPSATLAPVEKPNPEGEDLFFIEAKGRRAIARKADGKSVVVLNGSQLAKAPTPSYKATFDPAIAGLLKAGKISDGGEGYRLVQDVLFSSPSLASSLVLGSSTNGWDLWKDAQGRTMNEVYRS